MGYRHSRDEILAAAVEVAHDDGLAALTFGKVASRRGIADRTVVYYFATKDELITAVLAAIGAELQTTLAHQAAGTFADHVELVGALWPALAGHGADRSTACYLEAVGLAAAGVEPYRSLAPVLMQGWIDWLAPRLEGTPAHRRREATAAVALLDGLLVVRHVLGAEHARRALQRAVARRPDAPPA